MKHGVVWFWLIVLAACAFGALASLEPGAGGSWRAGYFLGCGISLGIVLRLVARALRDRAQRRA